MIPASSLFPLSVFKVPSGHFLFLPSTLLPFPSQPLPRSLEFTFFTYQNSLRLSRPRRLSSHNAFHCFVSLCLAARPTCRLWSRKRCLTAKVAVTRPQIPQNYCTDTLLPVISASSSWPLSCPLWVSSWSADAAPTSSSTSV